jgi:hypothetical protein
MTNAAVLDRHQAHIFYLSKVPGLSWHHQTHRWMQQNKMLWEKGIYDIHWD